MKEDKELKPHFFGLVAFNFHRLEAETEYHKNFTLKFREVNKRKLQKKRYKKDLDKLRKDKKKFLKSDVGQYLQSPSNNLGFFQTKEEVLEFIKENQDHIHEGNYYQLLLIERRFFGYEGYDLSNDAEVWMRGETTGDGWFDYQYVECNKPDFFERIIGFI